MQNNELERPRYPFPPFGSCEALARMLHLSGEQLDRLAHMADNLYRPVEKYKKDGSPRPCYNALPALKKVQGRIKCVILRKVVYLWYLTGGLLKRDYVENARMHTGQKMMVNNDITDFFPATSADLVFDTWRHLFHFPKDVARTLTRLTTRHGELP